jgi:mRNA interferase RelE/StbE
VKIAYTIAATRQLRALAPAAREQIIQKLHRYAEGGVGDVKTLKGRAGSRLRIGRYRVIFTRTEDEIVVVAVGDRRDIYR